MLQTNTPTYTNTHADLIENGVFKVRMNGESDKASD